MTELKLVQEEFEDTKRVIQSPQTEEGLTTQRPKEKKGQTMIYTEN